MLRVMCYAIHIQKGARMNPIYVLAWSLAIYPFISANMAPEGFERFLNYYFVETGTYQGKSIRLKTHTIVINNMHCCDHILFNYLSRQDIYTKINPDYIVTYINGGDKGECKDNIMVAYILKK